MFSDTHFHFRKIVNTSGTAHGTEILEGLAENRVYFALDIGTECDDLPDRVQTVEECIEGIPDINLQSKIRKSIYFSAGIWPEVDAINERESRIEDLRSAIEDFKQSEDPFSKHLVAIGEGGLDHHWNPSGVDGRNEGDFDKDVFQGERELFEMQLDLAKEMDLPFIVHTRDAYAETIDVLRSCGYSQGIIHCYSYGLNEAKTFLDLGWYIALGGAVTYTKKSKMEDMIALLNYLPKDRLLLETDAPYLAPVPMRGNQNSPLFIRYTYEFIAQKLGISVDKLSKIVDENCQTLFKLKK